MAHQSVGAGRQGGRAETGVLLGSESVFAVSRPAYQHYEVRSKCPPWSHI